MERWNERTVKLTANTVLEIDFEGPVNTVLVRNLSSTTPIYMDLRQNMTASDYETFAPADGWGVLTRPYRFSKMYLLATADIPQVRVYEVFTENPVVMVGQMLRAVATEVSVTSTVGLKPGDLNLDATKDLQVDVKTLPSLPAGANLIGKVDVNTLPSLPAGTNNIGKVDVNTQPDVNLAGATAQKVSAAAAGDVTVKAAAGKVFAIRAGAANVVLKDGTTERWSVPSGAKDEFPQPIACGTSIVLNFAAAGDAWILYL